jgi:hypothetical protein
MSNRNRIIIGAAALTVAGLIVGVVSTSHDAARAKSNGQIIADPSPTTTVGPSVGPAWRTERHDSTSNSSASASASAQGVGTSSSSTSTTVVRPFNPCHNSTDPACGDFRWDPDPGPNAPMTADVRITPAHPAVGQKVTFTIRAHDPDASRGGLGGWGFGDGPNVAVTGLYPGGCDRHGPWTPPARTASTWEEALTNTYRHAGAFRASFFVRSATPDIGGCPDPYASNARAQIVVPVSDHATQDSQNSAGFTCEHGGPAVSGTHFTEGEEQPPLQFFVYGGCPHGDPSQAAVSADVTNQSGQTVLFPGGIDAVVHLYHEGSTEDVHVTDPGTTSLAPGQHVRLSRPVTVEAYGGYGVTGTISYSF